MQNQMKEELMKLEVRRTCSHLTSGVVGLVRRVVTLVVLNQVFFSKSAAVFVPMYMCTINNKTCALQHTTGCKDERNIVAMRQFERTSYYGTQNVKTHNRTKHKLKKIRKTDPTKHSRVNSGAHEG